MFSLFRGGIGNTDGRERIQLCELVKLNKNHPQKNNIDEIRTLRREGNLLWKEKKRTLMNITPACLVHERSLKGNNFYNNFIIDSGYIYIDFDFSDIENVESHKTRFINRYGDIIAYCAISSSKGGLSVLIRHNSRINTPEQYTSVWNFMANEVFKDFTADESTKDLGRAMYVSYDPDVYVNYENIFDLKNVHVTPYVLIGEGNIHSEEERRGKKKKISNTNTSNTKVTNESIDELCIPNFTHGIRYKTPTVCRNPIIDIEKREYIELFFNKNIKDTKKHKTYKKLILAFLRLNPTASKDDLLLYMTNLNNRQEQCMGIRRLKELINYNWNLFHSTDFQYDVKYKGIHINPDSGLTRYQRNCISNKVNGQKKQNESIIKIKEAKEQLATEHKKVNIANVIKLTKLSRGTVTKYFNSEEKNMSELEREINEGEVIYPYVPEETDKPKRKRKKKSNTTGNHEKLKPVSSSDSILPPSDMSYLSYCAPIAMMGLDLTKVVRKNIA